MHADEAKSDLNEIASDYVDFHCLDLCFQQVASEGDTTGRIRMARMDARMMNTEGMS